MLPCCLGLIILIAIPLIAWGIWLHRKGFFSSFSGRFIIWGTVLLVLTIAYYPILKHCFGFTKLESAAQFGDQYGALNCFISGLAFIGLVLTLLMQREDLNLQRKEMRDTRKEFEKQTELINKQTILLEKQVREEQLAAKNNRFLQERTAWMQETMELISRFSDELRSLQCSFGYNPSTQQYRTGRDVATLLVNAVIETCVQNFALEIISSNYPNAIPALPKTIKNDYFKNIEGLYPACETLYPLMNFRLLIKERIEKCSHLSEVEKSKLLMTIPLDTSAELAIMNYFFEAPWKKMWLVSTPTNQITLNKESEAIEYLVQTDAEKIALKLFAMARNFVARSLSKAIDTILVDKNKNFAENLSTTNNQETLAAYHLFQKLNVTLSCENCSKRQVEIIKNFVVNHVMNILNNIDNAA